MSNLEKLKTACDKVLADPALVAKKDSDGKILTTFCNMGAKRIANAMGCDELDGLVADEQYKVMIANKSGTWAKVDGAAATEFAMEGGLAFAILPGKRLDAAHGHIAVIYPSPMQWSGSLGKEVPMVANVGVKNIVEKESMAFPPSKGEADYFCWED